MVRRASNHTIQRATTPEVRMRRRTLGLPLVISFTFLLLIGLSPGHARLSAQLGGETIFIQRTPADPAMPPPAVRDANAPPPSGTASIKGRVTAAETGNPLRRAQVRISSLELRVSQS